MRTIDAQPYLDRLAECSKLTDPDIHGHLTDCHGAHRDADGVLCEFLTALGYADIVEAHENVEPKWYS